MYYVYLLRLSNKSIYTGSTDNLKHRFERHANGMCLATRNHGPVKLIWYCSFPSRTQARKFENYLKSGSGQSFRNRHFV